MLREEVGIEELKRVHKELTELRHEFWLQHDLFSAQWWLLLAVLVISWYVWWRLVDKRKLMEIVLYGVMMSYLIFIWDQLGYELNLWLYSRKLFRVIPQAESLDWGILPILHMLVFQYFRSWRSYILVNIVMAAVMAFVYEPLSIGIGIYSMLNWEYVYSFPLYVAKAAIIKRLVEAVARKQGRSDGTNSRLNARAE
ncbi:CBO0543 family protein [Cohnella panacarvi]|uniref:CBO0543 family protein n=1 Tax=Cohnella panacarvi TaxID=400776 RepID=UPI0004B09334|nr:CBO0543 family protein [Cohnella panacarvi]